MSSLFLFAALTVGLMFSPTSCLDPGGVVEHLSNEKDVSTDKLLGSDPIAINQNHAEKILPSNDDPRSRLLYKCSACVVCLSEMQNKLRTLVKVTQGK